jgi:hypothetical protein
MRELMDGQELFNRDTYYRSAPPLRGWDRLIVFLGRDGGPANGQLLDSTIWLQDGTAYAFRGNTALGIEHLDYCWTPSGRDSAGVNNEGVVRKALADILARGPVRQH